MAYDEHLAGRVSRVLTERKADFYEKKMFGGVAFMVDEKMCVVITKKKWLMARVGPERAEELLANPFAEGVEMRSHGMKGFITISPEGWDDDKDLEHWVDACLAFNPFAKASKKKKK